MPKSRNRKNHKNKVKAYHDRQKNQRNTAMIEFNEIMNKYKEETEQLDNE